MHSAERVTIERAARQGELDGARKASVTTGHAMKDCETGWCQALSYGTDDVWLKDDGEIFTHPHDVDAVSKSLGR